MNQTKRKIAIPTENDEKLNAVVSEHFGHCAFFTVVELVGTEIKNVSSFPNAPHHEGGCAAPIMLLKSQGVDTLLVGGMGMRPLVHCQNQGIQVFTGISGRVSQVIQNFIENKLSVMTENDTCRH